jgi:hypothetical protein
MLLGLGAMPPTRVRQNWRAVEDLVRLMGGKRATSMRRGRMSGQLNRSDPDKRMNRVPRDLKCGNCLRLPTLDAA